MKKIIFIIVVVCFFIGCASMPEKTEMLVRYPLKGEIVWSYTAGNTDQDPQFIINHDDLQKFIEWLEKEKSSQ